MKRNLTITLILLIVGLFIFVNPSLFASDTQQTINLLIDEINHKRADACLPPFGEKRYTADEFINKEAYKSAADLRAEEISEQFDSKRPGGGTFQDAYPENYDMIKEFRYKIESKDQQKAISQFMKDPSLIASIKELNNHKVVIGSYADNTNNIQYYTVVILGESNYYEIKEETETEEIDFQTVTEENPELAEGEEKVIQIGVPGKKSSTSKVYYTKTSKDSIYSCNNSNSEQTVDPIDEIIEVGTMKISTFSENIVEETEEIEIPYEREELPDSFLPEGVERVIQEGKPGIKRITYEVKYENGKEIGREVINEEIIKEPVTERVQIGTKKIEEVEEVVIENYPYDTVELNDPTLPKGETKIDQEGKDGKLEVTYRVKYENGVEVEREKLSQKIIEDQQYKIILIGTKEKDDVIVEETEIERTMYETIYIDDPTLPMGEEKLHQKGKRGEKEIVYLKVYDKNGKLLHREKLDETVIVKPTDEIILVGTKVDNGDPEPEEEVKEEKETEDIPYRTIEEDDPTLPKGETKVKQAGKKGKKEITYKVTYEDGEEVKREKIGEEIIEDPLDEIILVGTKEDDDGDPEPEREIKEETVEEDIPYQTIEEDDPTLPKGETKVKQAGKKGKKEITYEVTYEDGKEVNREKIGEEIIEDPIDEIILVGTKEDDDGEPDPTIEVKEEIVEEDIAYSVVHQDDPTLPKGEIVVKQLGEPGKKKITYQVTYKDGVEVKRIVTFEETISSPIDEIILIGTKEDDDSNSGSDIETKEESKVEDIPYETIEEDDPTLPKGETKVKQAGKKGKKEIVYEITYKDGVEIDRIIINEKIIEDPVDEIIIIGTKVDDKTTQDNDDELVDKDQDTPPATEADNDNDQLAKNISEQNESEVQIVKEESTTVNTSILPKTFAEYFNHIFVGLIMILSGLLLNRYHISRQKI